MAGKARAVKLTANFEANLLAIESFWDSAGSPDAYDRLLQDIADSLIPHLEQHPQIGRPFLQRTPHSLEAQTIITRLSARIGRGDLREYLLAECLVLYAIIGDDIYLLAIRHHRQLSFDFPAFWP